MAPPLHRLTIDWTGAQTISGVFLEVHALGLLVTGDSGVGKSELALELVSHGHRLIADDAVEIVRPAAGILLGRCPALLRDLLEVRGLGVVNVRRLYGDASLGEVQRVDLILELRHCPGDAPPDDAQSRLSGQRSVRELLGVAVPAIGLRARLGHNQRALAEAACRDHWLRLFGYRSDEEMIVRQQTAIGRDS